MSTIIIGLGSTGRYVVEKVRQLHLQFTGTAKPNDVDYLAFDTEETLEQRDDGITRVWMSLKDVRAQVPILKRREGNQVWQWTDGKLSNSGESVRLSNAAGIVVDQVSYMSVAPWPVSEQSGTIILMLRDLNADNHIAGNWTLKQYPDNVELIPAAPGTDMIYDINGRPVERQPRGIVIINGKLYFYK